MIRENDHYRLEITRTGLLHLTTRGEVVMDRGALHEFLDMSQKVPSRDPHGDLQRSVHHYIQVYRDVVIKERKEERDIHIAGQLDTEGGLSSSMEFQTFVKVDDTPIIKINVWRRYMRDIALSVDDSICFLSPPSFAEEFYVYSPEMDYMIMDDDDITRWKLPTTGQISGGGDVAACTRIPRRLKATMRNSGYGVLMGDGAGFGVILADYNVTEGAPSSKGEFRAHRPRPPAEKKFDELEFQWSPTGPRSTGMIETAKFLVVPCGRPEDVEVVWLSL